MQLIHGPYIIDEDTIDRYQTLDAVEIGKWYIVINGAIHVVGTYERGKELVSMLSKLR